MQRRLHHAKSADPVVRHHHGGRRSRRRLALCDRARTAALAPDSHLARISLASSAIWARLLFSAALRARRQPIAAGGHYRRSRTNNVPLYTDIIIFVETPTENNQNYIPFCPIPVM